MGKPKQTCFFFWPTNMISVNTALWVQELHLGGGMLVSQERSDLGRSDCPFVFALFPPRPGFRDVSSCAGKLAGKRPFIMKQGSSKACKFQHLCLLFCNGLSHGRWFLPKNAVKNGPPVTFRERTKVVIITQQRFTDAVWVLYCLWHSDRFRKAWCLWYSKACVCAQSYLTLWDPVDYSCQAPLSMGFSQARILEWVVISFSRRSSQHRDRTTSLASPALACGFFTDGTTREAARKAWKKLSHVRLFATSWTVASPAPLSMESKGIVLV